MENKNFNIIIAGVGGQGIITLLSIINEAAFAEGYDVRSSELHGLSQRGGSVETHIRFGKNVNSPMIEAGRADLIIGLEAQEGLRGFSHAGKQTVFLVNKHFLPFEGGLTNEQVLENLKKLAENNLHLIPASEVCEKELGKEVVSGIYLLGYAVHKNLIPLKAESVLSAIEKTIPEKYRELNVKAFNLAHD